MVSSEERKSKKPKDLKKDSRETMQEKVKAQRKKVKK